MKRSVAIGPGPFSFRGWIGYWEWIWKARIGRRDPSGPAPSSATVTHVDIWKICCDITSLPVWRLYCWIWVALLDKRLWGSKFYSQFFVRLGLKIISGDFEEDLTKIVGGVGFQMFLIKPGITENLYNRKLSPLNIEFVFIQGIQWYLIFENRSNGSKVTVLTKVQLWPVGGASVV